MLKKLNILCDTGFFDKQKSLTKHIEQIGYILYI